MGVVEPDVVADHGGHHVPVEGGPGRHAVDAAVTASAFDAEGRHEPAIEEVQAHVEIDHQQQLEIGYADTIRHEAGEVK